MQAETNITIDDAWRLVGLNDSGELFLPPDIAPPLKACFGEDGYEVYAECCGLCDWNVDEAHTRSQWEDTAAAEPQRIAQLLAWYDAGQDESETAVKTRKEKILSRQDGSLSLAEIFFLSRGRDPDVGELELMRRSNGAVAEITRTLQCELEDRSPADFIRDERGRIEKDNPDNVRVLLAICGLEIRWNSWLERAEICSEKRWPWQDDEGLNFRDWTCIDDTFVAKILTRAKRTKTRFTPAKDFVWDTLLTIAHENSQDPTVERLDELEGDWDGMPRLDTWLSRACGVPKDDYHQAVARNIIGGMVRRIREPGCKHDTIATLIGSQGLNKSTLAAIIADMGQSPLADILAGRGLWFTDTVKLGDEAKELVLSLAGNTVVEISELSGSSRDVAAIKAMISRQVDSGRTAYARAISQRPRRNIFVASTNEDTALIDDSGNRRFLPIKIDTEIDVAWVAENIAQLVGEAAYLHSRGESFAMPRDVWSTAAEHQEAARQQRPHEVYFAEWFAPSDLNVFITAGDLLTCLNSVDPRAKRNAHVSTMRKLGFNKGDMRMDGKGGVKVWYRGQKEGATRYVPRQVGGVSVPSLFRRTEDEPGKSQLPTLQRPAA